MSPDYRKKRRESRLSPQVNIPVLIITVQCYSDIESTNQPCTFLTSEKCSKQLEKTKRNVKPDNSTSLAVILERGNLQTCTHTTQLTHLHQSHQPYQPPLVFLCT